MPHKASFQREKGETMKTQFLNFQYFVLLFDKWKFPMSH